MAGETSPPQPPIGALAKAAGASFPLQVCRSRHGYYLGTRDAAGAPFSRESAEYWPSADQAQAAWRDGHWTQRREP